MLRLLGIFALVNLFSGGHHHHRALRRGLFLGGILGLLASRHFDTERAGKEIREKVRETRRTARRAARDIRRAIHDERIEARMNAIHEEIEARKARREMQDRTAVRTAEPERMANAEELQDNRNLVEALERDARTAAMAASVPTIQFPEEDEKYHASRKYEYV